MIALVCDRCGMVLRGKAEVENTTMLPKAKQAEALDALRVVIR